VQPFAFGAIRVLAGGLTQRRVTGAAQSRARCVAGTTLGLHGQPADIAIQLARAIGVAHSTLTVTSRAADLVKRVLAADLRIADIIGADVPIITQ
jgi:hypothetical protein